ncbi:MAG: hypothetical protein J6M18_02570 [Actinomycetaceae bacterium]|nr:hypothetical protein [Actinomycetaceae bacterium]
MSNYILQKSSYDWRRLTPLHRYLTEEYLDEHCDLYLTSEYIRDDSGAMRRYYRLHAREPHNIEQALAYDISCPKCRSNTLKQVGRSKNYYTLGLYECPKCDRK